MKITIYYKLNNNQSKAKTGDGFKTNNHIVRKLSLNRCLMKISTHNYKYILVYFTFNVMLTIDFKNVL